MVIRHLFTPLGLYHPGLFPEYLHPGVKPHALLLLHPGLCPPGMIPWSWPNLDSLTLVICESMGQETLLKEDNIRYSIIRYFYDHLSSPSLLRNLYNVSLPEFPT
ncbi:hypothetical protein L798_01545 [Zootermopsis nevadensis]|uniref:Uncharacterized protein n=1 Tax=Zootermopsis nevadensis TaxID=136037 RepID=A0A067QVV2_ZOONE|nr:hypothetical protein L798_01545 [Zootermopsis nevadensis]